MSIEIDITLPAYPGPELHHLSIVRQGEVPEGGKASYRVYADRRRPVGFKHQYYDGWIACVRAALEALER